MRALDVMIVGGGPAGLSAALVLGRARKRVLLCDAGPPRNAAAERVNGFVTRDGTPPREMRQIGREQLASYPSVEHREARVLGIQGAAGRFQVALEGEVVEARRVLLANGVIDELPEIDGFRPLWGKSIFQCPYCHGWEVQNQAIGVHISSAEYLDFALLLRGWSSDVVALTEGKLTLDGEARAKLLRGGVRIEERAIARLRARDDHLEAIELAEGESIPRSVLFYKPKQRQCDLVRDLGLELDGAGFVKVDERSRETSRPGIHAGGDLITPGQSAILAAAAGAQAAYAINHLLTIELAMEGGLP